MNLPKDKIMMAILDDGYYSKHKDYPAEYSSDYAHTSYVFDTPQEFIEKWYEIDDGAWYWVFVNGEEILSGAVDPDDIESFEYYFGMELEMEFEED
jgi:hypothetical protein